MFEHVPFVGSKVFTERKLKKQVFEQLRFFPSKVKYYQNFLLLINLGKTNCKTAE